MCNITKHDRSLITVAVKKNLKNMTLVDISDKSSTSSDICSVCSRDSRSSSSEDEVLKKYKDREESIAESLVDLCGEIAQGYLKGRKLKNI